MNPCSDHDPMLQALLDGELDAANALAVETHLEACLDCAEHYQTLQALRERLSDPEVSPKAPTRLREGVEAMIAAGTRPDTGAKASPKEWMWRGLARGWAVAGAMAMVAASLLIVQLQPAPIPLEDQLVASHVRSLLGNHLIDVATSDRHVVRPWFNGKIDFAPPVPDLAEQGFPLVGGRLDYADSRVAAAVVYKRRAHVINLFVLPARAKGSVWQTTRRPGKPTSYSVVHWTGGGLEFWAVSDLDGRELERFHKVFAARAPS